MHEYSTKTTPAFVPADGEASWKSKEASSPHEVRLAPLDTNPVFQYLRDNISTQYFNISFLC